MLSKISRLWPLMISASMGFLLATILFLPRAYASSDSIYRVLRERMKALEQIIRYVNHFYFDTVDFEKIMDGAFQGLMESLDPHSNYIPAKEQENISELFRGNFQGIGIEFDILDGYITVISPIPDSPSDLVGLMPGDKIRKSYTKDCLLFNNIFFFETSIELTKSLTWLILSILNLLGSKTISE